MDNITVSQRAREAAADYYDIVDGGVGCRATNARLGNMDGSPTVQLVARFERDILAHTQQSVEPVAWMYERGEGKYVVKERVPDLPAFIEAGWTETPLYPHPPATDVAALVEAAKKAEVILSGAPAIAQYRQSTLTDLRQALAPFTKGQNDELA